jgi:Chaperone of endosialidase
MKKQNNLLITSLLVLGCFAIAPVAKAVVPAPDGGYPGGNTAEGQSALFSLTTGGYNTAVGFFSLRSDTVGSFNTAIGAGALFANTGVGGGGGDQNTATGAGALLSNTDGIQYTADGAFALFNNTTGGANTALGSNAGSNIMGSGNICIGATVTGVAGENNTTRIGNIYDSIATDPRAVDVNSDNKLGTLVSSRRYKQEIKPMDKTSEVLLALKPVTFHYKQELDPRHAPMFGLIAEDVKR